MVGRGEGDPLHRTAFKCVLFTLENNDHYLTRHLNLNALNDSLNFDCGNDDDHDFGGNAVPSIDSELDIESVIEKVVFREVSSPMSATTTRFTSTRVLLQYFLL